MKVLYFHQHFSTPLGTAPTRSFAMAKQLIARGHQVTMVCGRYDGGVTGLTTAFKKGYRRGVLNDIDIIELDLPYSNHYGFLKRTFIFIKYALRSIKIALSEPCDLVFATSTPLTASIPGLFARWLRRKPFVFEVRDLWPELPKTMGVIKNPLVLMGMSWLEWLSYHSAQGLIGLSPGIVQGITRRGIAAEKIKLLPNGCDIDVFTGNATPWRPAQVNETDYLAVFTGMHGIANGLDAAINVASTLQQRGRNDIKIALIGQGKLKSALQERAVNESLHNIVFHDPIDKTRLCGLLQSADIGLQLLANIPSFYYGTSPNKFFDYIAAGLPVLNNYPGWLADLIIENDCGLVVRPEDPEEFADALEFAADNPELMRSKGLRARKLAETRFNRFTIANEFVDWLESFIPLSRTKCYDQAHF